MVGSEVEKINLEDCLSRGIARGNDSPITQLNKKNSVYLRAPHEFSSIENDEYLYLYSWNVHVTLSYLDILRLLEDLFSQFDVVGLCQTFLCANLSLSIYYQGTT